MNAGWLLRLASEVPAMINESQFSELLVYIRGLNGCLVETAQEVADLRVDLQDISGKLAAILAIIGGAQ